MKILGERLRMIRKHLGIRQQQLAVATNLSQPAISRLENGEEVYASALMAVLNFYQDKISLDYLLTSDVDINSDQTLLYCSRTEIRQKLNNQLSAIANGISDSLELIEKMKSNI